MIGEDDEIITEIRRNREALAAAHGNDLARLVRHLQEEEAKSGRKIVSLPPRRPQPVQERLSE